jgi:hypothetical protein
MILIKKPNKEGAGQNKLFVLKTLLSILPLSFSFDFRGEEGGAVIQILMAAFAVFLSLLILIYYKTSWNHLAVITLSYTVAIIAGGTLIAVYNDVPLDRCLRVVFPYVLFLGGICCGSIAGSSQILLNNLSRGMVIATGISVMFRYYYSTQLENIEINAMRYQLLSPASSTLIAYICARVAFMQKISLLDVILTIITTMSVSISITRSYLITIMFAILCSSSLTAALSWRNQLHAKFRVGRRVGLIVLVSSILTGSGFAFALRPDVFIQWSERLVTKRVETNTGDDVNFISRIAEAKGIWEIINEEPKNLIFGMGFGNTYLWSYDYAVDIGSVGYDMMQSMFAPTWWASHSPFTYAMFFGGVPALIWQLWIFYIPISSGLSQLAVMRRQNDSSILINYLTSMLSVLLYLSMSITANPLGERMSAQLLGCSVGILVGLRRNIGY